MKPSLPPIKYVLLASAGGLMSSLILILIWNHISGVSLSLLAMSCLPCMVAWGLAAIFGWRVSKRLRWVPVTTYFFALMIIVAAFVLTSGFSDPSIVGWVLLSIIGLAICGLPSLLLIHLLIPLIFKDR